MEGVDQTVAEGVAPYPTPARESAAAVRPDPARNPPGRDGGPPPPGNPLRVGHPDEEAPAAGQACWMARASGHQPAARQRLRASGGFETSGHHVSRMDGAAIGRSKNQHRFEKGPTAEGGGE